jgi:hypothetical protein
VLDPELRAVAHRVLGDLGPRGDHNRVDSAGDRAQVVEGAVALDLVSVRVHREDLVTLLAQTFVDDVAAVALRMPGDADDGYSLVSKEVRCGFLDR